MANVLQHLKSEIQALAQLESELHRRESEQPGAAAALRKRCEHGLLAWAPAGWGGDLEAKRGTQHHPLAGLGGCPCSSVGRVPTPVPCQLKVYCQGFVPLRIGRALTGHRPCKLHSHLRHDEAEPLRRGETFCVHHNPSRVLEGQCEGMTRLGERCVVHKGSTHSDAAPLHRGAEN